ncbi:MULTISPECIES: CpxP family protein [Vibrio]|uniref:CpxP family protein n=1 Tax=Vibrio algicola TaxID=2662262 RepID=A0A5Q0TLE8_9VIBR|nr:MULTISPECIES: CpxP family protein [Vibrio]MBD1576042.1 CpxP family protein [Vibrio sp. S11_S32]
MKSLIKKSIIVLVAAPLALGSVSALANNHGMDGHQGKKGGHPGQQCHMDRGIWKQLDLTDAQKTQMKDLRQADRAAMKSDFKAHQQDFKIDHQKMQKLVMADNFDQAAVKSLAQEMATKQVDQQVKMAKSRHDMFNVLTTAQKQDFSKLQAEQHEKCMQKWQKMKERREAHADKKAQ